MNRVLVTGGAGMIGCNLVKRLVTEQDVEVRVVDNLWRGKRENLMNAQGDPAVDMARCFFQLDLRDPQACQLVMEGVDEVYHLADIVAGIKYVFANQTQVFHDNLLVDTNTLHAAVAAGVKRFVYIGTACSYPKAKQTGVDAPPFREEDVLPAEPESAYGWSKFMGELQTELCGRETKMATGVVRLHNVYGTPTDISTETSQVIPALMVKAIRYPREPFIVWGSGNQGRAFLHVDDVVEGVVRTMQDGLGRGCIQLGTHVCTPIRQIAEMVVAISGKPIEIQYDLSKPEGDKGRCADCTKAGEILGWSPKVRLEDGLAQVYKWIGARLGNGGCSPRYCDGL